MQQNHSKRDYSKIKNPVRKVTDLLNLHTSYPREKLGGILYIVGGLEYHSKKIKNYERAACRAQLKLEKARDYSEKSFRAARSPLLSMEHESVAYINRLGQLAHLFTSDWFKENIKDKLIASKIPSILALQPLRNKYTAHRQQDRPHNDDSPSLGQNQDRLMSILANNKWLQFQFATHQRDKLLKDHHPAAVQGIEIFGTKNNTVIFEPTKIHPIILSETFDLLEHFFESDH